MAEYKIISKPRNNFTKGETKRLRSEGRIPAVYYFHKQKPIPISIGLKEIRSAIQSGNRIFDLTIGKENHKCVVKDVQFDPITDNAIHVDFMGVRLEEIIHIDIPINIVGESVGVKTAGGVLTQHLWELEVKCKVSEIPEALTIDVSNLDLGDSISVSDIKLEKDVEILTLPSTSIVSVVKPTGAAVEEVVEEEIEEAVEEESKEESEKEKK
ncbi:MAG: 50S ribosomal protein L25 [Candidatus Neomarinimicrobiota bacterium]|nr:MAG: 50S ribosomal protein L25 [Candidatus Neomarinimicrobiota bacterium]